VTPLRAAPAESWSALVARGQFAAVVAQAERRGVGACETSCSVAELRALADAARYTGRGAMAESALLSVRQRFGESRDARAAAFLLGRLAEARGSAARAEHWYEAYLSELPNGELAAEALAGKLRTLLATRGRAAAEPVAREYLARYPTGVHAQTARSVLEGAAK
jgi:TolA-binding protein